MTATGTLRNTSTDRLREILTRLEKEGAALGHFNGGRATPIQPDGELGVHGGFDEATAPLVVRAEADLLVAGTSVFGGDKKVAVAMELFA